MKEIETNKNRQLVPTIFTDAFPHGFGRPMETEIDQIAGDVNREFIASIINWRHWTQMMNA